MLQELAPPPTATTTAHEDAWGGGKAQRELLAEVRADRAAESRVRAVVAAVAGHAVAAAAQTVTALHACAASLSAFAPEDVAAALAATRALSESQAAAHASFLEAGPVSSGWAERFDEGTAATLPLMKQEGYLMPRQRFTATPASIARAFPHVHSASRERAWLLLPLAGSTIPALRNAVSPEVFKHLKQRHASSSAVGGGGAKKPKKAKTTKKAKKDDDTDDNTDDECGFDDDEYGENDENAGGGALNSTAGKKRERTARGHPAARGVAAAAGAPSTADGRPLDAVLMCLRGDGPEPCGAILGVLDDDGFVEAWVACIKCPLALWTNLFA